jgi:hypothetical protein
VFEDGNAIGGSRRWGIGRILVDLIPRPRSTDCADLECANAHSSANEDIHDRRRGTAAPPPHRRTPDRPEQAHCHRIWCALPRTMDTSVHHRANLRAYAGELFIGKRTETKQFHKIRYSLVGYSALTRATRVRVPVAESICAVVAGCPSCRGACLCVRVCVCVGVLSDLWCLSGLSGLCRLIASLYL